MQELKKLEQKQMEKRAESEQLRRIRKDILANAMNEKQKRRH